MREGAGAPLTCAGGALAACACGKSQNEPMSLRLHPGLSDVPLLVIAIERVHKDLFFVVEEQHVRASLYDLMIEVAAGDS